MKKIYSIIVNFLGSLPVDKYIHFIVGILFGVLLYRLIPLELGWRILISLGGTALIGTAKETYDYLDYGLFDTKDLLATFIGGVVGLILVIGL